MDMLKWAIILMPIAVFIALLSRLSSAEKVEKENGNGNEKQDKRDEQAKNWYKALKELGENPDLDALQKLSKAEGDVKGFIPYKALFNKSEYLFVLGKFYPGKDVTKFVNHGFGGGFSIETLPSAVHVKHLTNYIPKLKESIAMLEEKGRAVRLSDRAQEKLTSLKQELKESEAELLNYVHNPKVSETGRRITFYQSVAMDEEEILDSIDSKIKEGKPVFKKQASVTESVTSPALIDLNEFLIQNKLPNDVFKELQDTITQIETKLRNTKKEKEDEHVRMNAKALIDTAKSYHHISEETQKELH